jgi:hypothetical protein
VLRGKAVAVARPYQRTIDPSTVSEQSAPCYQSAIGYQFVICQLTEVDFDLVVDEPRGPVDLVHRTVRTIVNQALDVGAAAIGSRGASYDCEDDRRAVRPDLTPAMNDSVSWR